ncbi:MAG: 3-hydroxy-D-aspartate aldolase [Limisphaerales bacterium]|jgi:3-hydroxy-D-aspartate aldolase
MTTDFLIENIKQRPHEPLRLDEPLELSQLPTPALVLDRGAVERNIVLMKAALARSNKGFRPHAKTHKCPEIARLQLDAGAVGICVAKISEAVALTHAGVGPLLITSPLASKSKVAVLDGLLAEGAQLALVVDSELGVELLSRGLSSDRKLDVLVDLDVAMGRTGTRSNQTVERIHEKVSNAPQLTFRGYQHYAGHVMHIAGREERAKVSLELWHEVENRLDQLTAPYDILTGCGTGTYDIDTEIKGITDLQVGSYVFMDEEYRQIGGQQSERFEDFEVSLTIACTAISNPIDNCITLDGGFKSMASDTVPAACDEYADTKFRFAGDEHGVLIGKTVAQSVQLGDVVRLVTPHCDPTVNLHDWYWVLEDDGLIHSCWPITGRGCTW